MPKVTFGTSIKRKIITVSEKVKGMLAIASGALIIFASKIADIPNEFEGILLVMSIVNISVGIYLTKGILGRK